MSMDSFVLTLDTTGPHIEITGPDYTTTESMVEIRVVANEQLSNYQEFYLVDSKGIKHNVIFNYEGDHFIGELTLSGYPLGMITFYATVEDTVLNRSNQATHTIKISETANVQVSVSSQVRPVIALDVARKTESDSNKNSISAADKIRRINTEEIKRKIGVSEKNV